MKFHVTREACCSQDDQLGPLDLAFEMGADATLQDLTEAVIRSGFLQFTSTHSVMVGQLGNEALVRVFGPHSGRPQVPQYLKEAGLLVRDLSVPREPHLRFVFNLKG